MNNREQELVDEIILVAVNQGDFYPSDPEGSVDEAFEQWVTQLRREWDGRDLRGAAIKEVKEQWKS